MTIVIGMEAICEIIQILSQETLAQISKGPLLKFTLECKDEQKVNSLWCSLFRTFSTESLSQPHTTAACNAVSAFLSAAVQSGHDETRWIALSSQTWLAIFNIYLDRFEDAKPKPMNQVLSALIKILTSHPETSEAQRIQVGIIKATIPSITLGEPRSRLKASLAALEHFIRKDALSHLDFMQLLCDWLREYHEGWRPSLERYCEQLSIYTTQFVVSSCDADRVGPKMRIDALRIFILGLLVQAVNLESTSSAGSLLALLCERVSHEFSSAQSSDVDFESSLVVWADPVKYISMENLDSLEAISNHILAPLFSVDANGFRAFVHQLPIQRLLSGDIDDDIPVQEFILLFSALQVAKKLGLVHEDYIFRKTSFPMNDENNTLTLNSHKMEKFLLHREQSIRVAALSLLITTPSTTKPISSAALRAIMGGLPLMHAHSDPQSRSDILSLTRKLMVRLRGSQSSQQSRAEDVQSFLEAYVDFLKSELQPCASYQRHIMALKSLFLVVNTGIDPKTGGVPLKADGQTSWRFSLDILHPSLFRLLADLLSDPFEDVRSVSSTVLGLFPYDFLTASSIQVRANPPSAIVSLLDALSKAVILASKTSRADHADTVARLYHLFFSQARPAARQPHYREWFLCKTSVIESILDKLEQRLSHQGGLLASSMREAPLHGYVSALRYIIGTPDFYISVSGPGDNLYLSWRMIHDRIMSLCDGVWREVKPILCADSPEGRNEDPIEDLELGPKDILSYSWRALRESSLLLHTSLANSTYGPGDREKGLQGADYKIIGLLSFTQLAELRHRGAFSTVSQTFSTCCQRCGQSNDEIISTLPTQWYQDAIRTIQEQSSKHTRRSAGLPALMTGILSSDPGGPLFKQVMNELHDISLLPATQGSVGFEIELPQVHAMNCLKDIFINNKLGPHTEPFIMSALTTSAQSLSSPIWAIRNCGLMLFRSLMTRMYRQIHGSTSTLGGVSRLEAGMRISFQKYPGLVELVSELLTVRNQSPEEVTGSTVVERVFPALELIGEKIPSISGDDDRALQRSVIQQIGSPIWAVREHAAKIYASLVKVPDILGVICSLSETNGSNCNQNDLHGRLLCIRFTLQRLFLSPHGHWRDHFRAIVSLIEDTFSNIFKFSHSPFVQAALLNVFNDCVEKGVEFNREDEIAGLISSVFQKNSLQCVFNRLIESSNRSMRFLSETRASSLLRRSLTWSLTLKVLVVKSSNDPSLSELFLQISASDSNATQWLLQRTDAIFNNKQAYKRQLVDLYLSLMFKSHPESVITSTTLNIACLLEDALSFRAVTPQSFFIRWAELRNHLNSESQRQVWSREMTDAELRLHGCLLTLQLLSPDEDGFSHSTVIDLRRWFIKLYFAMEEVTEFSTRYSAVLSVKTFARVLRRPGGGPQTAPVLIDVYLILYDMLNDDDEEIRDTAASIASWVLSYSFLDPGKAVAFAPLAVSELLAEFIARHYSACPRLFLDAVRRLCEQEPHLQNTTINRIFTPVPCLMAEYTKRSAVLFEEEKQNLFIDEVREIEVWANVLSRLDENSYDKDLINSIFKWVTGGLSYFIDITVSSDNSGGLFGWTSTSAIYIVGLRLFRAAELLLSETFLCQFSSPRQTKDTIISKLQHLHEKGRIICMHDEWLTRIESVLNIAQEVIIPGE